ncbi:TlpA family protein disulfide reductase [Mangrovibacterium lignilyticum]|uniref:TlpA family protein disulfide reductase n=1 Tax=Mangrovibacterium lignilyticum TaxID=2668052 RepID=UPI0013D6F59A|nr:TlpA disulfide reductase family protein [Mangrovibacterium lignilyticum]
MKLKFRKALLLLLTISIFSSCKTKINIKPVQQTSKPVFITGKVLNLKPDKNTISIYVNEMLSGDQITYVSLIDSSGNFQVKFNQYYPQDVLLSYGYKAFPIIVHPKDSIHIVFDAEKISDKDELAKSILFSGSSSKINSKLIAFHSEISKIVIPWEQYCQYEKESGPDEFTTILDSLKSAKNEVANQFIQQGVSKELEKWINNEIDFDYYNWLARYPSEHAKFNNLEERTVVPSSFYDFMNIDFTNEMLSNSKSNDFIGRYLFSRVGAFSKKFSTKNLIGYLLDKKKDTYLGSSTEQKIEIISGITKDKLLTELLIAQCFFNCLDRREIEEFEKHYKLFEKTVNLPCLREPLINKYVTTKKHFERPQIEENTLIKSAKDTPIDELISKIIQEHQGKIIYLDIWAAWCSPCRKEMPNSTKLMNALNSDEVDFVYLCIDSEEDKWKALISELNIEGSHYLATPDQSRFVYKLFEMNGVPQYILIDSNGNIVDKGIQLRPSESLIKTKIEELLKQ